MIIEQDPKDQLRKDLTENEGMRQAPNPEVEAISMALEELFAKKNRTAADEAEIIALQNQLQDLIG